VLTADQNLWIRRAGLGSLFLLFGLLIALCFHVIIDVDIWWHLKAGQYILKNHSIPARDVFSFPSLTRPWLDLHWLYQVLVYGVFSCGGPLGLILWKMTVLAAAFGLLVRTGARHGNFIAASFVLLPSLLAFERFLPRPEILTELFMAIYLLLLCSHEYRGGKGIYLIPFLQIVWTNTEGLFILGIVLPLAFLSGNLLERIRWPFRTNARDPAANEKLRDLLAVTGAAMLACLINPYGLQGALFPFTLYTRLGAGSEVFSATVAELAPPPFLRFAWKEGALFFFNVLVVISVFSFVLNLRQLRFSRLLALGGFLFLAVLARRNIPLFVCVALPLTTLNLGEFSRSVTQSAGPLFRKGLRTLKWAFAAGLICITIFLLVDVGSNNYARRTLPLAELGTGFSPYMYPVQAVDFIERVRLSGRGFNNIGIGGYLIWRGYPERLVFIDGRLEVHERDFYTEYIRVMQNPSLWDELATKYDIDYAILQHTMGDTQGLIERLQRHREWTLAHVDGVSVVFVRNNAQNQPLIEQCAPLVEQALSQGSGRPDGIAEPETDEKSFFHPNKLPFEPLHWGTILAELGRYEEATTEYQRALQKAPHLAIAHYDLGLAYLHAKQYDNAIECLKQALQSEPHNAKILGSLGLAYGKKGWHDAAETELRTALRLDPRYIKARYDLAEVLVARGDYDQANHECLELLQEQPSNVHFHGMQASVYLGQLRYEEAIAQCEAAVSIDDQYVEGFNLLGFAWRQLGRLDNAMGAYEKALALDTGNFTAHNNLGVCFALQKRYAEAREHWEAALRSEPTHQGLQANLARLSEIGKQNP